MGASKSLPQAYKKNLKPHILFVAFVSALSVLLLGNSLGKAARFLDNRDGTVTDQTTGLMWTEDAALAGIPLDWYNSLDYVARLNAHGYAGYRDWRLPNLNELSILLDTKYYNPGLPPGHPFADVKAWYWTGTTKAGYPEAAWRVYFFLGNIDYWPKRYSKSYLWPVRSVKGSEADVSRTGQVYAYYPSDDGSLKIGRPWPKPRFKDHGDGTVTDQLTGLMWLKDANPAEKGKDWPSALAYVARMNNLKVAGRSDWRLPHRKELQTLFDFSQARPALPAGHLFSNVAPGWYWSQDINVQDKQYIWCANLATGAIDYYHRKHHRNHIWPVRNHR